MSTATSSATSTAASATATSCGNLYDIPSRDASCAMPFGGNHTDLMSQCCKDTDVVAYYDNCGLYCLAVGQSVADLTSCLYDNGAAYQDVFCSGNTTATATGTGSQDLPASASASVISSAGSNSDNNDGSAASSSSSPDAAAGLRPDYGVSKIGLTIGALLVSATMFGAFQL